MKTILIVSDVDIYKQINGVGTWIINTKNELEKKNYRVVILDASSFKFTFSLPSYPEIKLVLSTKRKIYKRIKEINPDYIHIVSEGTLGFLAQRVCVKNSWCFTTAYHTKFPEYVFERTNIKFLEKLTLDFLRWFHSKSNSTIVTTDSLKEELLEKGFKNISVVPLGINLDLFKKNLNAVSDEKFNKPIFLYFGRISIEKNVESFLKCELQGTKLLVGDGPMKNTLENKYKDNTFFLGYKSGQELVDLLSVSDVSVFTSKTDTFGLTILESLACSLPVAAFDVQGPKNIITNGYDGYIGDSLEESIKRALQINKENCRKTAEKYSWDICTDKFIKTLVGK